MPRDASPDRTSSQRPAQAGGGGRILLTYFSRRGENYWNGGGRNLKVGNTEVLARAISVRLERDVHRIEASVDPRNVASARLIESLGFEHEGTAVAEHFCISESPRFSADTEG